MKILSVFLLVPIVAWAEFRIEEGMVRPFQLKNQNMQTFIADYAKAVDRPLLANKVTIKGTVNFSTNRPITIDDFNKMVVTVLSSQGLNLIDDGAFLRVISEREIRYSASKFYTSKDYPHGDQYILVKHELKNPLGSEITKSMRPFFSRYGRIISFSDGHTIILSEKGRQAERIIELMDNLDSGFDIEEFVANKKKSIEKKIEEEEGEESVANLKKENMRLEQEILEFKSSSRPSNRAGRL